MQRNPQLIINSPQCFQRAVRSNSHLNYIHCYKSEWSIPVPRPDVADKSVPVTEISIKGNALLEYSVAVPLPKTKFFYDLVNFC